MSCCKPIESDRIVERHAALGCTEVWLVRDFAKVAKADWYSVELFTPSECVQIGGYFVTQAEAERRLMDFRAGVVAAQLAAGMKVDDAWVNAVTEAKRRAERIALPPVANGLIGKRMRKVA